MYTCTVYWMCVYSTSTVLLVHCVAALSCVLNGYKYDVFYRHTYLSRSMYCTAVDSYSVVHGSVCAHVCCTCTVCSCVLMCAHVCLHVQCMCAACVLMCAVQIMYSTVHLLYWMWMYVQYCDTVFLTIQAVGTCNQFITVVSPPTNTCTCNVWSFTFSVIS